jgi:hypothetical protein
MDVAARCGECFSLTLVLAQHMIVRAILQCGRSEERAEVLAQKCGREQLITRTRQARPNEMPVIGHQNIDRTNELVSPRGVQKYFAETRME